MTRTPDGARTTAQVDVLGPITLRVSGETVRLSELERGLLAAAAGRGWIGGAALEQWLWGDHAPASARNRVQSLVSGLRRKGAHGVLVTEDSGYRLGVDVDTDLDAWNDALELARHGGSSSEEERADRLAAAAERFRGEPLHGAPSTPDVESERSRLRDQWLEVVESEIASRLAADQLDGLPTRLARLTADHPFHEGLLAQYVLCLGAVGQQQRALEVYRRTRERLVDELGVEPSERLQSAHQRVLNGDVDAKPRDRTATRSGWADAPVPRTLPRAPADFVGRQDSLATIRAAAARASSGPVVVSISGLSGSGTSALAAAAGADASDLFPDGTLYLDAATLTTETGPHAAMGTFLGMLGLPSTVVPDDPAGRTGLYRSVLSERRVMVVLDNVDQADGTVNPALRQLLPTAPGSFAIVTSRATVEALDPTVQLRLGSLDEDEAVALLEIAAGPDRIHAESTAVRELVRLTGGLPLALRLVGSRLASRPDLTVRGLVSRLDRGSTAALDPSAAEALDTSVALVWDRLPEGPRRAAALLSHLPFHTVSAWVPQHLLGPQHDGEGAIDALVDACFVEPVLRDGRLPQYRLHDVVARFARERVPAEDPDADLEHIAGVLLGHLVAHHHDLPLQFMPAPPVPATVEVARAIELTREERRLVCATELPLAAACARALVERDRGLGLAWRLLAACDNARGFAVSDDDWLETIDTVREGLVDDDQDARLGRAMLDVLRAWHLQDLLGLAAPALELATTARPALEAAGARSAVVSSGLVAAYAALSLADRAAAERELAAVDAALSGGANLVLSGWSLVVRGELHNDFDELLACEQVLSAGRAILSATPERIGYARATTYLSRALARQGRWESARDLADEALAIFGEHGAVQPATIALDARAEIALGLEDPYHAAELASVALGRARASRDEFLLARSLRTHARALAAQGRLDDAARQLRECVDRFEAIHRTLSVVATWRELAAVLDQLGRTDDAALARRSQAEAEARAATQPA